MNKFKSEKERFNYIKDVQCGRMKIPDYKDKYTWLTIYDDDINFLIKIIERVLKISPEFLNKNQIEMKI